MSTTSPPSDAPDPWDGLDVPALLTLERLDANLFRSRHNQRNVNNAIFGGQMLGQALAAATNTVTNMVAHSLHAYFLRSGSASKKVIFQVEATRDGKGFCTRRVVAIQDATPIYHMECSFRVPREGFDHQQDALPAPSPETLESLTEHARREPEKFGLFAELLSKHPTPIDVRLLSVDDAGHHPGAPARRRYWVRVPAAKRTVDLAMQRNMIAYLSDYWFSGVALMPHHAPLPTADVFIASIDHAVWIHRDARVDDWLLYETESPSASGGTGFTRGLIYDRTGRLIASTAQETLQVPMRAP